MYIKSSESFPLVIDVNQKNQYTLGYLQLSIDKFLEANNKNCKISDSNYIKEGHSCIVRIGLHRNEERMANTNSFIACIAFLFDTRERSKEETLKLLNPLLQEIRKENPTADKEFEQKELEKLNKLNQPNREKTSISQMKMILIQKLTYDIFIALQNGNLITIFADSNTNKVDINDEFKKSNIYNKLNNAYRKEGDVKQEILFKKIISAHENFKKYLDPNNNNKYIIDHTYLWDLVCKSNILFENGLNMVIINIPEDDMRDKVEILCPSNNYSEQFYDENKDTVILIRRKKNDYTYFEIIGEYKQSVKEPKLETRINMNTESFKDIKTTISIIKKSFEKCKSLESMSGVYTFKKNIILSALVRELKNIKYKIIGQVFNYDGKVIAVKVDNNGKVGILPCYPSAPMVVNDDDIEYIWINTIIGETYEKTIDYLLEVKGKTNKILCKPLVNVKENGIIVGIITETNQFVPVYPEDDYIDTNYKGINKTITTNNFNEIDTVISTDSSVDIERIEYIKKINLETGFYKIFRNTIRIMLSEHNHKSSRTEIEAIIASDKLYNKKLRAIINILKTMTNKYFKFSVISKEVINDINNVVSCYKNDDLLDTKYCIINDSTKEKQMMIPKENLINKQDNETIYFGKLADELLRFNRIKTFIFEPKSFLSLGDIGYNLGDDEIVLMQTLLNKDYFVDIEKEVTNEYIKTNTYDIANPLKTKNYTSMFNMDDLSKTPNKPNTPKQTVKKINKRLTLSQS